MRSLTCRQLIEFLGDHHDGTLPADERARFDEHLAACPECREYLRTYEDTIRLGKAAFAESDDPVPAEPIPADVEAKLLERFRDWKQDGR